LGVVEFDGWLSGLDFTEWTIWFAGLNGSFLVFYQIFEPLMSDISEETLLLVRAD
jgi:hypothetical protein